MRREESSKRIDVPWRQDKSAWQIDCWKLFQKKERGGGGGGGGGESVGVMLPVLDLSSGGGGGRTRASEGKRGGRFSSALLKSAKSFLRGGGVRSAVIFNRKAERGGDQAPGMGERRREKKRVNKKGQEDHVIGRPGLSIWDGGRGGRPSKWREMAEGRLRRGS